jgi:hypothetical protein
MSLYEAETRPVKSPSLERKAVREGVDANQLHDHQALLSLQRTSGNAGVRSLLAARQLGGSSGEVLDEATRLDMESRLGHDFKDVRVHTGEAATQSAAAVGARAYTMGTDVVFQDGEYAPSTEGGRRTLAHELTHVVQQKAGPVEGTPGPDGYLVSDPSDRFEREAEHVADRVMSDDSASQRQDGNALQREAKQEDEDEEELQGSFLQREGEIGTEEEQEEPLQGTFTQRKVDDEGEEEEVS